MTKDDPTDEEKWELLEATVTRQLVLEGGKARIETRETPADPWKIEASGGVMEITRLFTGGVR